MGSVRSQSSEDLLGDAEGRTLAAAPPAAAAATAEPCTGRPIARETRPCLCRRVRATIVRRGDLDVLDAAPTVAFVCTRCARRKLDMLVIASAGDARAPIGDLRPHSDRAVRRCLATTPIGGLQEPLVLADFSSSSSTTRRTRAPFRAKRSADAGICPIQLRIVSQFARLADARVERSDRYGSVLARGGRCSTEIATHSP